MHPMDHMSTAVEYSLAPNRSSGALWKYRKGEMGDLKTTDGNHLVTYSDWLLVLECPHIHPLDTQRKPIPNVPVPQGDDQLSHGPQRAAVLPGQAKVGDLNLAAVVEQQVGGLEIAVDHPVVVQQGHGGKQLKHNGLDLGLEEGRTHALHEGFEVMLDEVHNDKDPEGLVRR
ncbi:hypothetical protein BC936DRAFT_141578 [Jimgerdemannia flammicorona]|uniref:Uncharacterized protein n=2 Tax=Jimgerdemannia flammicorona TaxID=994334 RepID=A0A433DNR0_9FUNG|nr:hypothetical protein BC936DRAFT_141578 [Jimgerdemannia flammicorona]RUS32185.1 hypothetical protein BC938DRAFT_476095 [Jimgerdemannia flammicorona]